MLQRRDPGCADPVEAGDHGHRDGDHGAQAHRTGPQTRVRRLRAHRLQRPRSGQGGCHLRLQCDEGAQGRHDPRWQPVCPAVGRRHGRQLQETRRHRAVGRGDRADRCGHASAADPYRYGKARRRLFADLRRRDRADHPPEVRSLRPGAHHVPRLVGGDGTGPDLRRRACRCRLQDHLSRRLDRGARQGLPGVRREIQGYVRRGADFGLQRERL